MSSAIEEAFAALVTPASGYNVTTWSGSDPFRIGKTAQGHAVLLTPADPDPDPPSELKRLKLAPRVQLRFNDGAEVHEEYVGLVEFHDDDASLVRHFLSVATMFADLLENDPNPGDVSRSMRRLVRLFEPQAAKRGSIIGLWGELLLISGSADVPYLVDSWHSDADDQFDFSAAGARLEVKTTTGRDRVHSFRLHQLLPVDGTETHVASIMTTPTDAGTSVTDLIELVQDALASDPDRQLKLFEQITEVLGGEWEGVNKRFDQNQALASLRILDAEAIPQVEPPPPEVLRVELTVDCSAVPPTASMSGGFPSVLLAT